MIVGHDASSAADPNELPATWLDPATHDLATSPGHHVLAGAGVLVGHSALGAELPDWHLVIIERLSDAFAPTRRVTNRLALSLVVTLALALAFAYLAGRGVVKPLGELTDAISNVSGGDLPSLRVSVRTEDEVGTLGAVAEAPTAGRWGVT